MFRPFFSELNIRLASLLAPTGYLYLCYNINEVAGLIHISLLTEAQMTRWGTVNGAVPVISTTIKTGQAVVYPTDTATLVHAQLLAKLIGSAP